MKIKESNKLFAIIITLIILILAVLLIRSLYISSNSNKDYLPNVTMVNSEELETYIMEKYSMILIWNMNTV